MVWNGPNLTNAFEDELVSRGIACLACGPSQQIDFYREKRPAQLDFLNEWRAKHSHGS